MDLGHVSNLFFCKEFINDIFKRVGAYARGNGVVKLKKICVFVNFLLNFQEIFFRIFNGVNIY